MTAKQIILLPIRLVAVVVFGFACVLMLLVDDKKVQE